MKKTDPSPLHNPPLHKDDSSTLSLAGADKETPPLREMALLLELTRSLTDDERHQIQVKITADANPGASAKELMNASRALQMKAALEAQKSKGREEKDSSSVLSLSFSLSR